MQELQLPVVRQSTGQPGTAQVLEGPLSFPNVELTNSTSREFMYTHRVKLLPQSSQLTAIISVTPLFFNWVNYLIYLLSKC